MVEKSSVVTSLPDIDMCASSTALSCAPQLPNNTEGYSRHFFIPRGCCSGWWITLGGIVS